jgi:hypothetical protein
MFNAQSTIEATPVHSMHNDSVKFFDANDLASISSEIQLSSDKKKNNLKPSHIFEKDKEIAGVIDFIKSLEKEHENYKEMFVTRGNQALYALLSKIYALAIQIDMSDNKESILKSIRNAMSLQKNIKTQKNSTALTMIVRWIVGGSRQLAHSYSKALEAAYNDNISTSEIVSYFSDGGLNKAKKKCGEQRAEKFESCSAAFKQFMYTADSCHDVFENTKISWTEEIFMDNTSGNMIILGVQETYSQIQGYRAFNLSTDAYNKICKIISNELFKNMRDDEISAWVEADSKKNYEKKKTLRENAKTVL